MYKCDDGLPPVGGTTPNATAAPRRSRCRQVRRRRVHRPADWRRRAAPTPAPTPTATSRSTSTSPCPTRPAAGGYPLLFFMHGCCAGNKTSWEATTLRRADAGRAVALQQRLVRLRGYVVINYTARGFVNGTEPGLDRPDAARLAQLRDQRLPAPRLPGSPPSTSTRHRPSSPSTREGGRDRRLLRRRLLLAGAHRPEVDLRRRHRTRPQNEARGGGAEVRLDRPRLLARPQRHALQRPGAAGDQRLRPGRAARRHACPGAGRRSGCRRRRSSPALYISGKTGIPPGTNHTTFPP